MGAFLTSRKDKRLTEDLLKDLQSNIEALEKSRKTTIEKRKHLIGSLILYSIILYFGAVLLIYFCYLPESVSDRIKYTLPLAIFPVLVWIIKRFLHWYFVNVITKNEAALQELKEEKKKILDDVMETETYKKAKEILAKYNPENLNDINSSSPTTAKSPEGQDLRHRKTDQSNMATKSQGQDVTGFPVTSPTGQSGHQLVHPPGSKPCAAEQKIPWTTQQISATSPGQKPKLVSLPRPLLPQNRTFFDKFVDYLLVDGPQNRYALICKQCHSHNGMALKEEFEYFSFQCCYCNAWNPARKQRPTTGTKQQQNTPVNKHTDESRLNESAVRSDQPVRQTKDDEDEMKDGIE